MGLSGEIKRLNLLKIKEAIQNFDHGINDSAAYAVAKYLLHDDETISLDNFAQQLECEDNEDIPYQNGEGFDPNIILRIRMYLNNHQNPNCLREQFENLDIKNENVLSISSFKSAFLKLDVGLTMNEISRLSRQCPKNRNGLLLYQSLLAELRKPDERQDQKYFEDLQDFVTQLKSLISSPSNNFLQDMAQQAKIALTEQGIRLATLVTYLQKYHFPESTEAEILPFANVIDIDGDGWISEVDLKTFIECNPYMLKHITSRHKQPSLSLTASAFEYKKQQNENLRESLYPTEPLKYKDLEKIMRELRQKLYLKKISNYEFFKLLDQNQDGFVTIQEFQSAISKLVTLEKEKLDGLFAYMDRQKIGMIDYQSLLWVMNQTFEEEVDSKPDDNWDWPYQMIAKLKRWVEMERLSAQDAFRVLDFDFDGFISKQDLKHFLVEVLKQKEVTQSRVHRLFKLLDQYKRGQLQLVDIQRLLQVEDEAELVQDTCITGGRKIVGKSIFDWKLNAKQQIGIVISRLYASLKDAYNQITNNNVRMTYKQFANWVQEKRALIGFDLTDQLLQQVFSEIDPHKKGYLTFDDWKNSFTGYQWQEQMFKEVQQQIQSAFPDLRQAYVYFSGNISSRLTFENFETHLNSLFPDRFSYTDISLLWTRMTNDQPWIDFPRFRIIFELKKRPKTTTNANSYTNVFGQTQSKDQMCEQIVFKLRGILKASNQSLEEVFQSFDTDGSGYLSNLEFKNALRQLNLGLTSKEIDLLLNYMDESGDGRVNWDEFAKKLQTTQCTHLIGQRCKQRLAILNNHLHHYLLSPKDAFRTFDPNRLGFLTFPQFCKLMDRVSQMSNEPLPAFNIMKDMFEVIDIRGDGVLDEKEWVQTFGQYDPPETIMKEQGEERKTEHKTKPKRLDYFNTEDKNEIEKKNFATGSRAAAYFESTSKDYDKVMKILGRNRKYLVDVFNRISKNQAVTYEIAAETLQNMFQQLGLKIDVTCYPLLLRFAEKDGIIDYKFMLDVYKERAGRIDGHPSL